MVDKCSNFELLKHLDGKFSSGLKVLTEQLTFGWSFPDQRSWFDTALDLSMYREGFRKCILWSRGFLKECLLVTGQRLNGPAQSEGRNTVGVDCIQIGEVTWIYEISRQILDLSLLIHQAFSNWFLHFSPTELTHIIHNAWWYSFLPFWIQVFS